MPDPDLRFQKLLSFKTQLSLSFLHISSCAKASASEHPIAAHELAHSVIETSNMSVSLLRNLLIFKVVGTGFCLQLSLLLESLELVAELFFPSPPCSAFLLHPSPRDAAFCGLVGAKVSLGSRGQAVQPKSYGWRRAVETDTLWRKKGVSRVTGLIQCDPIREEFLKWLQIDLDWIGKQ